MVILAVALGTYWAATRQPSRPGPEQQAVSDERLAWIRFKTRNDRSRAAAVQFRRALEINPTDDGATYDVDSFALEPQRPAERSLQPYWEKMLRMGAEAIGTTPAHAQDGPSRSSSGTRRPAASPAGGRGTRSSGP